MSNAKTKRSDFPIAFRFKKEVLDELNRLATTLYPNLKKPNKSEVIRRLIMDNRLEYIEQIEKENRELKAKIEHIEKVFKE
jgi:hypothetical protein